MEAFVLPSFCFLSVCAFAIDRLFAKKSAFSNKDVSNSNNNKLDQQDLKVDGKFKTLQQKYFAAYFCAIFGDWLQGPYVYQLYSHYGFQENQIAVLFLAGFASSSTFGTFTGPLADKYGRKRLATLFSILYATCCVIKLSSNFWVLLLGRLIGGISTSLLFSVFESWYVREHIDTLKLSPDLLAQTFSTSTFANGLLAILAGVTANVATSYFQLGPVAPFLIAIPCFIACFMVITFTWNENFGDQDNNLWQSYKEGLKMIMEDKMILFLGLVQSIVESCMYIFVFLWTPVLSEGPKTPLGLIFSSFMVSIMIGSTVFSVLNRSNKKGPQDTLYLSTVIFAFCTLMCTFTAMPNASSQLKFCSFMIFLLLEFSIGLYFPSIGCLRGVHIPESHRATVTNWFRVPMNLITCATLLAVNHPVVASDKRSIFGSCTILLMAGVFISRKFKKWCFNSTKTM